MFYYHSADEKIEAQRDELAQGVKLRTVELESKSMSIRFQLSLFLTTIKYFFPNVLIIYYLVSRSKAKIFLNYYHVLLLVSVF